MYILLLNYHKETLFSYLLVFIFYFLCSSVKQKPITMQKIGQFVCLIVFLTLMAISCTARTVAKEAYVDDSVHHGISKRQSNCVTITYGAPFPCRNLICYFGCCNVTYDPKNGSLTAGGCSGVTVSMLGNGISYCCNN